MVEFRKVLKQQNVESGTDETVRVIEKTELFKGAKPALPVPAESRDARELFMEGLALNAAILEWASSEDQDSFPLAGQLNSLTHNICEVLNSTDAWRLLCLTRAKSEPSYLPSHSMSASILMAYLASRLNYPDDLVLALSKTSFLHDTGMVRIPRFWELNRSLTQEELITIAGHPIESLKIIEATGCCEEPRAALTVAEHHERADGSGYPHRKLPDNLAPASQIMGIADTFLAMTHDRPYRKSIPPFDAVRAITSIAGKKFASDSVRDFLKIMSLYPIGCTVRLNNGMIARVIGSCQRQLTRPSVQIIADRDGVPAQDGPIIDLKSEKLLFIREPIYIPSLDPVFKIG